MYVHDVTRAGCCLYAHTNYRWCRTLLFWVLKTITLQRNPKYSRNMVLSGTNQEGFWLKFDAKVVYTQTARRWRQAAMHFAV